jgi:hypothetical protein
MRAAAIAGACLAIVIARAASAEAPAPPAQSADAMLRATLAADVAPREPAWRDSAEEIFPADRWSQSDDFHAREARRIVELANERGVSVEDVLRAIDEDLRRVPYEVAAQRGARAVPCKPRPFYD